MSILKRAAAVSLPLLTAIAFATPSFSFCGVVEHSASHRKVQKANALANKGANKKVKSLKKEYGAKLVLNERQVGCVGGAVSIDANGNQLSGPATCTATQGFCVNP
jgi:hypothetical protein